MTLKKPAKPASVVSLPSHRILRPLISSVQKLHVRTSKCVRVLFLAASACSNIHEERLNASPSWAGGCELCHGSAPCRCASASVTETCSSPSLPPDPLHPPYWGIHTVSLVPLLFCCTTTLQSNCKRLLLCPWICAPWHVLISLQLQKATCL